MLNLIYLLLVPLIHAASKLPTWHMKPLGSHIKPDQVDETFADKIITPEEFANKYLIPGKPLVFRDIVKAWPAFKLWTDEYLSEKYGDLEVRLEGKKEKGSHIPQGDVCLGRDRLKTFLNSYKLGANKYVVSELPTPMWDEVKVPPPLSCGQFLKMFVEIDIWINSDTGKKGNGGNSILHKDAYNTINCVLNGSKDWKLIELQYNDYVYQSWEGPMDAGYGGFSLINPQKVDAKEFPKVGKIPRWQLVTINAGDCLFLPSQMWHQVTSYGMTNRAVAFLFSQVTDKNKIDTTGCPESPDAIPLSKVDVDLQYSGTGLMSMGHSEIESTREMLMGMIDEKKGLITKRKVYLTVYHGHERGAINKKIILQKAKDLYNHMQIIARGDIGKMTEDLIKNMSRDDIRETYAWILPIEPSSSYEHEFSYIMPEDITEAIKDITSRNGGKLEKQQFIMAYKALGGCHNLAEEFWRKLAGNKIVMTDINATINNALFQYELHRRDNPDTDEDEEATIITPQGHESQPKRRKGGYSQSTQEENDEDGDAGIVGNANDEKEDVIEEDVIVNEGNVEKTYNTKDEL